MTLKSAPYYWLECDGEDCISRAPDDEVTAWDTAAHALGELHGGDWKASANDHHYCPDCWLYDEADNIVFNDGTRTADETDA